MNYPAIALASSSPRRRELLAQLGVNYKLVKADIDETVLPAEAAAVYVQRLALAKAHAGLARLQHDLPVLGADTVVVVDGLILGKPADFEQFRQTMLLLSGRSHQVMTAIALVSAKHQLTQLVSTDVTFRVLTEAEIRAYWATGEPQDKAGGYGIQGLAGRFVQRINGSYSAVVGLPLCETEQLLQQWQELS
ncbi:nucleoside triphosphate pyrophosphatase YhdE [Rheinheimera aquimaris]|uniref:dTTP/UTP pyrophosphatase n=1 Tax=Rheinheimera aquimaris TaxID=412437 RepID=A0ABN1E8K3_9GAMM|nr:Maf family protein [Rheinheimera aquimaris]MCB5215172.1 Maf-like protein [Rheinheimera aquimaris]